MQLAAGVVRVVHAGDAGEELEAQRGSSRSVCAHREQVLAAHVEGELAAVDDDPLDRVGEAEPVRLSAPTSASTTSSK